MVDLNPIISVIILNINGLAHKMDRLDNQSKFQLYAMYKKQALTIKIKIRQNLKGGKGIP